MPGERHSRRLAKEKPADEQLPSRARKENTRTLAAFSKNQSPIQKASKRKRRDTHEDIDDDTLRTLSKALQKSDEGLDYSNALTSPTSYYNSSLLARRPKFQIQQAILFNSNDRQDFPYYVFLKITPIINAVKKIVVFYSLDINDYGFMRLEELQVIIGREFVDEWADNRNLRDGDKSIFRQLVIVVKSLKGNNFFAIYTKDKKNSISLSIDTHYKVYDRAFIFPILDLKSSKKKKVEKAQNIVRSIPLYEISSNTVAFSDNEEKNIDELVFQRKHKKLRDSVITRQLIAKRAANLANNKKANLRKIIFKIYQYIEKRCKNYKQYYYVLRSTKSYYRITLLEQNE
ncbi:hypothetical protein BDZ45DRAFT_733758 [Acephala macrosclerotiorum]|nr:hypothetical protein BDZ45DRAFT_733758 [Acephala macrosclerotiorum]